MGTVGMVLGMLVVIILGILCGGGCHGQSKWYEQQPGQSDWFEQKQRETDKRMQQFDKEFQDKWDANERKWNEDNLFNKRKEMQRDWEDDNDIFVDDNGLIYKIIGGIAAFFVVLLVVGCCCVFNKNNHGGQRGAIHSHIQKTEPVQPIQIGYSPVPQQPGYAHQQPTYALHQPGYASQQPDYASQQPSHVPQQPSNIGQQAAYKQQQPDHKRQEAESEYKPTAPEYTPGLSGY